jgi:hypothetical protein
LSSNALAATPWLTAYLATVAAVQVVLLAVIAARVARRRRNDELAELVRDMGARDRENVRQLARTVPGSRHDEPPPAS